MAKAERAFEVGGRRVAPGAREFLDVPLTSLQTGAHVALPMCVLNGRAGGPVLWLSAAVHGDELNGVEIIRRLLKKLDPGEIHGVLLAVPTVNVFGFVGESRYLPDRRDLNRSFPGSPRGSLAARLAHLFMTEVVARCHYGIDMHTGSDGRANLPQIRADLRHKETRRCAEAFGAPALIQAKMRDGSLREAAMQRGVPTLLYEAGEAQRFDENAIGAGVRGVLSVMAELGMLKKRRQAAARKTFRARTSSWVRASRSGIFHLSARLGERVGPRQEVGMITDAFGRESRTVHTPNAGLVIGVTTNPLVYAGDALVHVART